MFFVETDDRDYSIREELRRAGFNISTFLHANVTACVTDNTPQKTLHELPDVLPHRQQRLAASLMPMLLPTTTSEIARKLGVRTVRPTRLRKWLQTRMLAPGDVSRFAQASPSSQGKDQTPNPVVPKSNSPTKVRMHAHHLHPAFALVTHLA